MVVPKRVMSTELEKMFFPRSPLPAPADAKTTPNPIIPGNDYFSCPSSELLSQFPPLFLIFEMILSVEFLSRDSSLIGS